MTVTENQPHGLKANAHGYTYQVSVLAMCMLRSWKKKYTSFSMETEKAGVGEFDDLVLKYVKDNVVKSIFVQMKHKNSEKKEIHTEELSKKFSDVNLAKLYVSYKDILQTTRASPSGIEVIYHTNIGLHNDNTSKWDGFVNELKETDHPLDWETAGQGPKRYTFLKFPNPVLHSIKQSTKLATEVEIEEFRKSLVFAVNQPDTKQLQEKLKKELGEIFGGKKKGNKIFKELNTYIWDWMLDIPSTAITYEIADNKFDVWKIMADKLTPTQTEVKNTTVLASEVQKLKGCRIIKFRRTPKTNLFLSNHPNNPINYKRKNDDADEILEERQDKMARYLEEESSYILTNQGIRNETRNFHKHGMESFRTAWQYLIVTVCLGGYFFATVS